LKYSCTSQWLCRGFQHQTVVFVTVVMLVKPNVCRASLWWSIPRFYATVRCRLRHYTKLPWREIKTKNGLQALTKAKQRKEASAKSVSQIQASSDGNTHKSKHKLRGGGGKNNPSKSKDKKNA